MGREKSNTKNLRMLNVLLTQKDENNNVLSSSTIPAVIEEGQNFKQFVDKLLKQEQVEITDKDGIELFVVGPDGKRHLLNLSEKVNDVLNRFGTDTIYVDVHRFVGTHSLVVITKESINSIFSKLFEQEKEIGGFLDVKLVRTGKGDIYVVNRFYESTKNSSQVSAQIAANTPHIWHLHPKNFGAQISSIDQEDTIRAAVIQSVTMWGEPPLSIVFCFNNNGKEKFFYGSDIVAEGLKGEKFLEVKCYLTIPDEGSFRVEKIENRCVLKEFDNPEGFLLSSEYLALSPKFLENCFSFKNQLNSIISLLKCIKGIYSPGSVITPVDLMRVLCLIKLWKRFGIEREEVAVMKIDSRTLFSVKKSKDPIFTVKEVKKSFLDRDTLDLMWGDWFDQN